MSSPSQPPQLSVVIAVEGSGTGTDDAARAVQRACRGLDAEIRVVHPRGIALDALPPGVALTPVDPPNRVPHLWATGIGLARGRVIALTTGHFRVGPEWARALVATIEAGAADYIDAMLAFVPAGDANCDGVVSAADLTAVSALQGPASDAPCARADVDGSGAIDATDAGLVRGALFDPSTQLQTARVFAGGPFSDRNPFPDATTGAPSSRFPENDFATFLPLTRLQLMSWRVQVLGTVAVPGSDFNAAIVGPVIGLRDRYRAGIAEIEAKSQAMFTSRFTALTAEQQDAVLAAIDADFLILVTNHTLEGLFCVPEYGGNKNLIGWTLIGYDGDSQPLGYSIFNETTMTYNERPDKPNSTPDPDEDFSGMDQATQDLLKVLVRVVGGPHFPPP